MEDAQAGERKQPREMSTAGPGAETEPGGLVFFSPFFIKASIQV